jgi:hypothetical protein
VKKLALMFALALFACALLLAPLALTSCTPHATADASAEPSVDLVVDMNDSITIGSNRTAAAPHKLGANFFEAGVDSGTVSEAGLIQWQLATPVTLPFGDPPITGIELRSVSMDLVSGTITEMVAPVGGYPQQTRYITISLSPANEAAFANALKTATANQLGTVFQ